MTTTIPDTELTRRLRTIWAGLQTLDPHTEPWEQWYAKQSRGGTTNGRAVAAILFDRAQRYWPEFFSPADAPAVATWGQMIDEHAPFATPDIIEQAVDDVAALGLDNGSPFWFLRAAERIMQEAHRGA